MRWWVLALALAIARPIAAWPVRHPALLFGGRALREPSYVALWKSLEPDSAIDEVVRNYPVRQPLLWVR